jgi:hypothetical protein
MKEMIMNPVDEWIVINQILRCPLDKNIESYTKYSFIIEINRKINRTVFRSVNNIRYKCFNLIRDERKDYEF